MSLLTHHPVFTALAALFITAVLCPTQARAEHADREKPVRVEFQTTELGDRDKTTVFKGKVRLTQGNLEILCDKLVATEDADGYYQGVATSGQGGLARFKDKLDKRNETIYGEAERIEFDTRQDKIKLFERAYVKKGTDEARGRYIERDGYTETFKVSNGPGGDVVQSAPQAEVILQPKQKPAK